MTRTLVLALALLSSPLIQAGEPKGTFNLAIPDDPTTLNPITRTDADSAAIDEKITETLGTRDDNTWEWVPVLAEKWEMAKDGKSFTFHLRDGVKFSDGTPLTSEDVKYSFDVFFEGRFQAPHLKVYFENIQEAKIIDRLTIQFIVKQPYFQNEDTLASTMMIIPKHVYGTGDPKDPKFNKLVIGTGPYMLEDWEKGQKITLKRNPNYWGDHANVPYLKKRYNVARYVYKVMRDPNVELERFKHGDIDYMGLMPEQYVKKTDGPEWGKKLFKVKASNSSPHLYSYGFIGWNEKNPIFNDKETRRALGMLINRDFMIEKFLFNMYEKAVGPMGNRNPSTTPGLKPLPFDPKKAVALLEKVGWKMGPKGLSRQIDGKDVPFEFTLISANPDFEKYATVIQSDMKAVGITLNYKYMEWNSFIKLIDERKFDAINLAWSVNDLEGDEKQIFHSVEIPPPGHNFVSYSNPALDKLIDDARTTMDEKKRRKMFWKICEMIADDAPYAFLFNPKYSVYAHSWRVKKPQDTLKYSVAPETWSIVEEP